jgi:hypothetical protein
MYLVSPIHTSSILHVQACWVLVQSSQPMSCTWYFENLILHFGLWHHNMCQFMNASIPETWNEWHPHFGRPIQSVHVWSVFFNNLMSSTWFLFFKHVFACIAIQIVLQESNWEDGTSSHKLSQLNKLSFH